MLYDPDIEAEQFFLGCMLKDPDLIGDWEERMESQDFTYPPHGMIWDAILLLSKNGSPVNPMHIIDHFRTGKKLEAFGDLSYINDLRGAVPSAYQHNHFGGVVRKNSAYRKLRLHAEKIMKMVDYREEKSESDIYQALDNLTIDVRIGESSKLISVKDNRKKYEIHLKNKRASVKTGLQAFDDWAKGLGRQWLYILSGRSGVGKTAKAAQMAYDMAKQDEGAVLFWSQEMPQEYIMDRIVSNLTGINYKRIVTKELEDHEQSRILSTYDEVAEYPLYFDDSSSVSIGSVKTAATKFKRKYGKVAALFVDYLTHMDIKAESGQNFAKAVGEVAKRFKQLARELDCPVILLAQINRDGAEGEPKMHHLKESGDIEQAADMIEILWRDEDAETGKDFVIITSSVAKGRFTGTKKFKYEFREYVQRFSDHRVIPGDNIQVKDGHITNHANKGRRRGA